jgi:retron-type reverse transcriptase
VNWILDANIRNFFDAIDRTRLLALVRDRVTDRRMLKLLTGWLHAGVLTKEGLLHPEAGTPQVGVISRLLANVYLNGLDQAWQEHGRQYGEIIRYAADLVVICRSRPQAEAALQLLQTLLGELGLMLLPSKTRIVDCRPGGEGFDFLGSLPDAAQSAGPILPGLLTPLARLGCPAIMTVQDLNRFLRGWIRLRRSRRLRNGALHRQRIPS